MCFYSVCIPEKYLYYFSENFNFLCFYYTNALADLLKNALQICDIFKCTCVYMTYWVIVQNRNCRANEFKGCKSLLYNIQTVQYIRLQIFNMDFMHTQFIYNYLIGSYWIGLKKCWSLCHDVYNFPQSVCNLQWKL